ncbi:MAG TPA: nucleotidyltransferase family protein [Vineibacter sp.]|nr:nucleotidyltransferase family protein [Vineibacter sp.]
MSHASHAGNAPDPTGLNSAAQLLWRALLGAAIDDRPVPPPTATDLRILADRLTRRCSAGWAASLLAPLAPVVDAPLVDPAAAMSARLLSKLTQAAQEAALRRMIAAGLHPVALKGFANAHLLYDDPTLRIVGDLDVLLPRSEIGAAVDLFVPLGYRFGGTRQTRWGFISDASYVPFYSPDGVTNIDLHVEPDAWPLPRGLGAADVLGDARALALPGGPVRVPRDEHTLLICLSNIAKDRFGWQTLSKAIDAARLLTRRGASLDWREIERRATLARLRRPLDALLALLVALGLPPSAIPMTPRPPRGLAGRAWRQVLADWQAVFPRELSGTDLLWRDLALAQTPATAARLNWWRLKGLLRPESGLPAEARDRGLG